MDDDIELDLFPNQWNKWKDRSTKNIVWALQDVDNDVNSRLENHQRPKVILSSYD